MIDAGQYSPAAQLLAICKFGGVSPRLFEALFRKFCSPAEILNASLSAVMQVNGIDSQAADRIVAAKGHLDEADSLTRLLADRDILIKGRHDRDYPPLLYELNDPPPLLYVRGRLPRQDKRTVAVVGAETASNPGIEMTTRLSRRFADEDIQVVSSLSGGIDAAAHLGCKAAGGRSFAVLDTGFDNLDRTEAVPLAIDIVEKGGIISEYYPDHKPNSGTVQEANRLMVGFAQAVVVPECYSHSARTLDLLSFCNQIGKLAFFIVDPAKGALADKRSLSHAVKNGAILVEGYERVDDIIKALV